MFVKVKLRNLFTFQRPSPTLLPRLVGDSSPGSRRAVFRFLGDVACEVGLTKIRMVLISATKQFALCSLELFSIYQWLSAKVTRAIAPARAELQRIG